jgi:hypothetical protein
VDSVDDLGVVDALEVDRHDAEVGVLDMRVIAKSNRGPITRMDPALCGVIFDPEPVELRSTADDHPHNARAGAE